MTDADVIVIGAGIAGASVGAALAEAGQHVVVLEAEPAPAMHTTGRSAAVFTENFGNPVVRSLTLASRSFLTRPPSGFADVEILSSRGALWIGTREQAARLDGLAAAGRNLVASIARLDASDAVARCPGLDRNAVAGAVWEPDAADIDVGALLQGYLRRLRSHNGRLELRTRFIRAEWVRGRWRVSTTAGAMSGTWIVNAAGAWADEVADACGVGRLGLQPLRRTAFLFDPPAGADPRGWPLVIDVDERFYFKPESGVLLGSLADETPSSACDAQPEEADVAMALDRIAGVMPTAPRRVRRAWAGLRTFAADRAPVVGPEPAGRFCWLAGQGGYGIQTAPALAAAATGLLLEGKLPAHLAEVGITESALTPTRFR